MTASKKSLNIKSLRTRERLKKDADLRDKNAHSNDNNDKNMIKLPLIQSIYCEKSEPLELAFALPKNDKKKRKDANMDNETELESKENTKNSPLEDMLLFLKERAVIGNAAVVLLAPDTVTGTLKSITIPKEIALLSSTIKHIIKSSSRSLL